jgi:undecaprenyl-diphosphatase
MELPGWLDRADKDLFLLLNGSMHRHGGEPLEVVLRFVNEMGNGLVLVPILLTVALLPGDARTSVRRVLQALAGLGATAVASSHLKRAFLRPRPARGLAEAFADGQAHLAFGERIYAYGFPSGHVATVTALAVVLAAWAGRMEQRWRRRVARSVLAAAVLLVGLARVYTGAHYPLDVLAGVVLGVAMGALGLLAGALVVRSPHAPPLGESPGTGGTP